MNSIEVEFGSVGGCEVYVSVGGKGVRSWDFCSPDPPLLTLSTPS